MTYEEIFSKTKELILSNNVSGLEDRGHLAIEVDITGEGSGAFYIELKEGNVYVEPYEYYDRDCKLIVTGEDFLKICEGSFDAVKAFTTGKLKVEGNIDKALEFSNIVESVRKKNAETAQPEETKEKVPEKKKK